MIPPQCPGCDRTGDGRSRYIVLGTEGHIERWRQDQRISRHDVIEVTTSARPLLGLSGQFEVITLPSWRPSPSLHAEVYARIRIIQAITAEEAVRPTTDILDRIDAATGCQQCEGPLGKSPSDDFCSARCQANWQADRAVPLVPSLTELRAEYLRSVQVATRALADFGRELSAAIAPHIAAMAEASSMAGALALELCKWRNTGPRHHQRAPRTIGRPR